MTDSARENVSTNNCNVVNENEAGSCANSDRPLRHSEPELEVTTMPFEWHIRANSACDKQNTTGTPDNWKPLGDLVKQAVADATAKREGTE